jgi:YVTN family beta-propeller protein
MSLVERKILTDAHGYREVSLDYRIARAAMLDTRGVGARTGRIACPGLDASRSGPATPFGGPSPSHGIGITSDQKILVANSRLNSTLYAYSLPDLKLLGSAALGGRGPEWLTISPDDKTVYVANAHTNDVSVVDIQSMKEIARVPVGFSPARNTPWIAP